MKRWRTPVGALCILVVLVAYIWAAMMLGQRLPDNRLMRLAYYVLAGTVWWAPLMPVIKWMAKDDRPLVGR
jgi:hypothetical protein